MFGGGGSSKWCQKSLVALPEKFFVFTKFYFSFTLSRYWLLRHIYIAVWHDIVRKCEGLIPSQVFELKKNSDHKKIR